MDNIDKIKEELEKSKNELNQLTIDLQEHQDKLSKLDTPETRKLLNKRCKERTPQDTIIIDEYHDITGFIPYLNRRIDEEKQNIAKFESEINSKQ